MAATRLLTKEEREIFVRSLNAAEPYDYDDPRYTEFDHPETDIGRMLATSAKEMLEDDDKLRQELEAKEKATEYKQD